MMNYADEAPPPVSRSIVGGPHPGAATTKQPELHAQLELLCHRLSGAVAKLNRLADRVNGAEPKAEVRAEVLASNAVDPQTLTSLIQRAHLIAEMIDEQLSRLDGRI